MSVSGEIIKYKCKTSFSLSPSLSLSLSLSLFSANNTRERKRERERKKKYRRKEEKCNCAILHIHVHVLCTEIIYIARILVVIIIVIIITAILVDFRSRVSIVEASILKQKRKKYIYKNIYIYINICLRISDILIDSSSKNWSGRVEREKEREWIGDLSKHVDIVINWIRSKESVFLRKRRKRKKMRESKRVSMSCTLNAPPLEASCLCSMWSS